MDTFEFLVNHPLEVVTDNASERCLDSVPPAPPPLPQHTPVKRDFKSSITAVQPKVSPKTKLPKFSEVVSGTQVNKFRPTHNPLILHRSSQSSLESRGRTRSQTAQSNIPVASHTYRPIAPRPSATVSIVPKPVQGIAADTLDVVTVSTMASSSSTTATPSPHTSSPAMGGSPPPAPQDKTNIEVQQALQKLKQSSVPQDLTSFLEVFQKSLNAGFNFLKKKITDPHTGLEAKVSSWS